MAMDGTTACVKETNRFLGVCKADNGAPGLLFRQGHLDAAILAWIVQGEQGGGRRRSFFLFFWSPNLAEYLLKALLRVAAVVCAR